MNANNKWEDAKFIHFMYDLDPDQHHGGATLCYVTRGQFIYAAVAYCHPNDRFVKAYGRAKSFGLLNQLLGNLEEYDGELYNTWENPVQFAIPASEGINGLMEIMGDTGFDPR